jgi:CMP-N-acetylneuraminic acid synthetase
MEKKHIVAIIPARGGSKSIPRKNIKFLNGIPLLAYSIAAAERSKLVDRIIVSTDDEVIADLARDIVVQLRPTSPLRPSGLVDEAVQLLLNNPKADSVRAVSPSGENPYKMWEIEDGVMQPLLHTSLHEAYNMPRQELPATYWQTGHVEAIRFNTIVKKQSLTGDVILPCIVPHEYAVDLDNLQQWAFAEYLLEQGNLDVVKPLRRDWFGHKFGQPEGGFQFYGAKFH